jgi:undecaprenyl-diphosphatase
MNEEQFLFLFTGIASTEGFLIATLLIITVFVWLKNSRSAVALFASTAGLVLTLNILKESFKIPRPENALIEVTGYAFPSGHAAGAIFLAHLVIYLCRNQSYPVRFLVAVVSLGSALAIGASRVAYQVHTPLQVFAGFVVGTLFALLFIYTASRSKN